jgi:hypothetical protein
LLEETLGKMGGSKHFLSGMNSLKKNALNQGLLNGPGEVANHQKRMAG